MSPDHLEHALRVYLVADPDHSAHGILQDIAAALAGGVTMVQLRAKHLPDRTCLALAREIGECCRARAVPFLVNDRVDVALAAGVDGVHLGVDDLPLVDARRLLGPNAFIGFSPETDDQAATARGFGASYLGVGPVFATASKSDAGAPIGPAAVGRRAALSGLPTIGIGGITATNAAEVIAAGAAGVAVVGAILRSNDPAAAAQQLRAAVNGGMAKSDW